MMSTSQEFPPATRSERVDYAGIPFPTGEDMNASTALSVPSIIMNVSPDSNTTSSSQKTSSDKLSALPVSKSALNTHRLLAATSNNAAQSRGYRNSLDMSASAPNLDSPSLKAWNTTYGTNLNLSRRDNSVEHSSDQGTPHQRVSFDSDRASLHNMQSPRQVPPRIKRLSDPPIPSHAHRSSAFRESQKEHDSSGHGSLTPPHSHSRATSPLRLFQHWSSSRRHYHRHAADDPFVPINPYKFKAHLHFPCFPHFSESHNDSRSPEIHTHDSTHIGSGTPDTQSCDLCVPTREMKTFWSNARIFVSDTLPREIYLNILLRLPAMYFSRIARVFQDAEVSKPDIQRMIESCRSGNIIPFATGFEPATAASNIESPRPTTRSLPVGSSDHPPGMFSPITAAGVRTSSQIGASTASMPISPLPIPDEWSPPLVSPALVRFKHSWEAFIDSVLREWKTLNVVSALLLSAILTMFQIPSAASDPVTRTAALLSLICALMSLTYGCMYIVRFGSMRTMFRAAKWAEEARKTDTLIWWNVWVLLAMPAIWLAWSMVLFVACILSFVWRTGSVDDPDQRPPVSVRAALGPRIVITFVFGLGMVYFALMVKTLRGYGTLTYVNDAWQRRHEPPTPKLHPRDIDGAATTERRGRERQRSSSNAGHGRDEDPEDEGKGLRSALGLSIMGIGSKEHEFGPDLEEGLMGTVVV